MKRYFLILLCAGLMACALGDKGAFSPVPLDTRVISSSLHCRPASSGWRVTLIDEPGMLELMASKFDAHLVGTPPSKTPQVEFNAYYILAIEMGRQPTAGFGIDAEKITASLEDHTAMVHISWKGPSSDALAAQIITSPCVLVRLERGDYDRILVKDQKNQILGQFAVESKK